MQKVFHFESPREKYQCDAAIVWCFDNRFELAFRKFLKRVGIVFADPIKVAGGAKCLSSPGRDGDREFVLDQIRSSIRLHGTRRVVLMVHSDCGAYGGLAAFGDDPQAEARHHRDELHMAAAVLSNAIPDIRVDGYFVDFEGVWEALLDHSVVTAAAGSPTEYASANRAVRR
jgi:carbonic anhydrase